MGSPVRLALARWAYGLGEDESFNQSQACLAVASTPGSQGSTQRCRRNSTRSSRPGCCQRPRTGTQLLFMKLPSPLWDALVELDSAIDEAASARAAAGERAEGP